MYHIIPLDGAAVVKLDRSLELVCLARFLPTDVSLPTDFPPLLILPTVATKKHSLGAWGL